MKKMLLVIALVIGFIGGILAISGDPTDRLAAIDKVKEKKFLAIQKA